VLLSQSVAAASIILFLISKFAQRSANACALRKSGHEDGLERGRAASKKPHIIVKILTVATEEARPIGRCMEAAGSGVAAAAATAFPIEETHGIPL
jgi:hypothetical protein